MSFSFYYNLSLINLPPIILALVLWNIHAYINTHWTLINYTHLGCFWLMLKSFEDNRQGTIQLVFAKVSLVFSELYEVNNWWDDRLYNSWSIGLLTWLGELRCDGFIDMGCANCSLLACLKFVCTFISRVY